VVVMRPCRSTCVTRPRTSALRWSAGRFSFATRMRWRMANTFAPFCGKLRMLLAAPAASRTRSVSSWQATLIVPSSVCEAARVSLEQALRAASQLATVCSGRTQGPPSLRLRRLASTRASSGASGQAAQGFPPGACRHSLLATPRPEKQGSTATGAAGAAGRAAQPPTAALIAVMLKAMVPVFAHTTHSACLTTFSASCAAASHYEPRQALEAGLLPCSCSLNANSQIGSSDVLASCSSSDHRCFLRPLCRLPR